MAGAHKKFCRIQHPEIYLLDLKVQYKHKMKLPLDMVSKHVLLYLCLPDYLIRFTLEPYNFTSNVFQDFVFTYFERTAMNIQLFKLFIIE